MCAFRLILVFSLTTGTYQPLSPGTNQGPDALAVRERQLEALKPLSAVDGVEQACGNQGGRGCKRQLDADNLVLEIEWDRPAATQGIAVKCAGL